MILDIISRVLLLIDKISNNGSFLYINNENRDLKIIDFRLKNKEFFPDGD